MDTEMVKLVLWIVSGVLMAGGLVGVVLATLFDRSWAEPEEQPAYRREAVIPAPVKAKAPPKPVDEKVLAARKAAYRLGILVFVALAILTGLEFWVSAGAGGSMVLLFLIALVKAGLIIQYYMHLRTVLSEEEAH
jgi:cytochrome c oxidase subunit 4